MALPRLHDLMTSYFHQDYDIDGQSDAEILRAFASGRDRAAVEEAIAEIDRLIDDPSAGTLTRFTQATGPGNMMIGDDDTAARQWLADARATLVSALAT